MRHQLTLRQAVVAEAERWLGTPYHAHARAHGHGVDCVHLLCAVYEACGLLPPFDPGRYPISWHLHRSDELYMAQLDARAVRRDEGQPGDVALFRFGRCFSHAGIVAHDGVVHAFNRRGGGVVMRTRLDEAPLAGRPVIFYDMYSLRFE